MGFATGSCDVVGTLILAGNKGLVRLQPHQIEETPEFKISSDTAFVRGLAYIKGTMRMLLDVDWLLARERFACEAHG